ncbi:MAG: hypothetical protein AB7D29_09435 [Campylobacterales bacterium]
MTKGIATALCAALLFGGCQTYNAFDMFKKDEHYEKALKETRNAQIINSMETKAKITATYLNPLYPSRYSDAEYFFVGVYIPDDYDKKEESGLYNKDYSLSMTVAAKKEELKLGEQAALPSTVQAKIVETIVKLDQNELYKKMPHTDAWSRYYVVSFPKQEGNSALGLSFKGPDGAASLSFPKVH